MLNVIMVTLVVSPTATPTSLLQDSLKSLLYSLGFPCQFMLNLILAIPSVNASWSASPAALLSEFLECLWSSLPCQLSLGIVVTV